MAASATMSACSAAAACYNGPGRRAISGAKELPLPRSSGHNRRQRTREEVAMNTTRVHLPETLSPDAAAVGALYQQLLAGWNARDADAFAAPFTEDGESIGVDGSQLSGRAEIAATLQGIFADHPTGAYVGNVRGVRLLDPHAAVLRAVAG